MKRFLLILLALTLMALPALAEADAVSSASVADYYADGILTGDDLMNAINAYSGFYAVGSVNPDGTPHMGFYIYSCVKVEESYYLMLGLSPNQTTANVDAGSELVAMYAALPAEGATYPTSGARMTLAAVTDEALLETLHGNDPQGFTPMYYEITSVRSLG